MSVLSTNDTACPFCKHPNEAEVWSSINVREDPELRDILLGGELNMIECESCHEYFFAEHFLLYHDQDMELIAFVYPKESEGERSLMEEKTKMDYGLAQANHTDLMDYPPVTLFGLDELVALVEEEEERHIQGEIVRLLAADNGLHIQVLKPSLVRPLKWPTVLPFDSQNHASTYDRLTKGLEKLAQINDRLNVYGSLYENLKKEAEIPSSLEPFLK